MLQSHFLPLRCLGLAFAIGIALCLSSKILVAAPAYRFEKIVEASLQTRGFSNVLLNDQGLVAYWASVSPGGGAVFTAPSPPGGFVADLAGPFSNIYGPGALNELGQVVFFVTLDPGFGAFDGIYSGPDPTSDAIANDGSPFSQFGRDPKINTAGVVAFMATLDSSRHGIFLGPNPNSNALVTSDGPFSSFFDPLLNENGQVVFHATLDNGVTGLFFGPDAAADRFVDDTGPFRHLGAASIDDNGEVLFWGRLDNGVVGIFTGADPSTHTFVDSTGPFDFFRSMAMNNHGKIVFQASTDSGVDGLYDGPSPSDAIIRVDDFLFGQPLLDLTFHSGLNNLGQVAFAYRLADGKEGIAVATPVPEPGLIPLTLTAAAVFYLRRFLRFAHFLGHAA